MSHLIVDNWRGAVPPDRAGRPRPALARQAQVPKELEQARPTGVKLTIVNYYAGQDSSVPSLKTAGENACSTTRLVSGTRDGSRVCAWPQETRLSPRVPLVPDNTGRHKRSGQATVEFALLYAAVLLPLTFGIVFVAEMYWVWHSMVEFTRDGARYAATHCWQPDSQNVLTYMQTHIPRTIDQNQFQSGGTAQIVVEYFQRDPATGQLAAFAGCSGNCSVDCLPDSVTISVTNYQFQRFVTFLRLPPVQMPAFPTSMPIESNGCDPEQNVCHP